MYSFNIEPIPLRNHILYENPPFSLQTQPTRRPGITASSSPSEVCDESVRDESEERQEFDSSNEIARKRLRNRMAQRKYRQRLKGRLQDLERQAAAVQMTAHPMTPPGSACLQSLNHVVVSSVDHEDALLRVVQTTHTPSKQYRNDGSLATTDDSSSRTKTYGLTSLTSSGLDEVMSYATNNSNTIGSVPGDYADNSGLAMSPMSMSNLDPGPLAAESAPVSALPTATRMFESGKRHHHTSDTEQNQYIHHSDPGFEQQRTAQFRVHRVLTCIQSMGFDSLDSFVSTYYTGSFEKGSTVYKAQKISRNRNLPNILAKLHESAGDWSMWESGGYRNEIVKSAEAILLDELDGAIARIMPGDVGMDKQVTTRAVSDALSRRSCPRNLDPDLASNKSCNLEDEVPHLWAVMAALTSDESTRVQQMKRQALLSIVSVLTRDQKTRYHFDVGTADERNTSDNT